MPPVSRNAVLVYHAIAVNWQETLAEEKWTMTLAMVNMIVS